MWHRLIGVVAALMALTVSPFAALAESRLALVIGNAAYESNTALPNPGNDAQAVAQLLNTAGFEVVMAFDLSRDVMKQTIEEFAARINEKGQDSAVLIYYAGHGLQVDGENYLVPVDAKLQSESDVAEQGVRLADIMGALEAAPSKIRIVILDACRNNPFSADAGGRGLAIVDAPAGSIVAYSTAPGTEAFDGKGKHSPYAAAFMRTLKQPDMPIEQVFKRVRLLVHEATDSKQTPWESSSLTTDFAFFANVPSNDPAAPKAAPALVPAKVALRDLGARPIRDAYEVVVAEDTVEYYEEFVRLYPTDPFSDRVRGLLSRRKQMIAWQNVTHRNTPEAYASFVTDFGGSDLVRAARRLQERPRVVNIAFPRRGEGRFGDGRFGGGRINIGNIGGGRPVIEFPRGNAGGGRPVLNLPQTGQGRPGPIVGRPQSGNSGINPNANRPGGPVIPFPKNEQGGNRPGPVANVPQNAGINPKVGVPVIDQQSNQTNQTNNRPGPVANVPKNAGINPKVGVPVINQQNNQNTSRPGPVANVPQNAGINPKAGRPVINRPQGRPNVQARPQVVQRQVQRPVQRAPQIQRQVAQPRQSFQGGGGNRFGGGGGFRSRR